MKQKAIEFIESRIETVRVLSSKRIIRKAEDVYEYTSEILHYSHFIGLFTEQEVAELKAKLIEAFKTE